MYFVHRLYSAEETWSAGYRSLPNVAGEGVTASSTFLTVDKAVADCIGNVVIAIIIIVVLFWCLYFRYVYYYYDGREYYLMIIYIMIINVIGIFIIIMIIWYQQ